MYFAYKMPELSLALQQIYIHRNGICPHWKSSVHTDRAFSQSAGCADGQGWDSRRDRPQPGVCLAHVGTLSNDAACVPGEEVSQSSCQPPPGSWPRYRKPSVQRNAVFQRTRFLLSLRKIPTEKPTAPKPSLSGSAHQPCPFTVSWLRPRGWPLLRPSWVPFQPPSPLGRPRLPCAWASVWTFV